MAITSGFFNSKNGDRKYNAELMSKYFDKLITSGVFPNPSTQLQVMESEGMTVKVLPGRGIVDCRWMENDADYTLTISASDAVLDRIDAVVMKLDLTEDVRDVHIEIKKGIPGQEPTPPEMTRDEYIKEYCLATIRVKKLAEAITQAEITDTRPDNRVCGWVTGLIEQVDTSTLFKQWQSAYSQFYDDSTKIFDEWFQHLKDTVSTATLIRTYTSLYTTTQQDETEIPINIPEYNSELDIFNVFINGLKLVRDVDFTIDKLSKTITLAKPVDAGTPIAFEVLKSVDGSNAETVVGKVEELEKRVDSAENKIRQNYTIPVSAWTLDEFLSLYTADIQDSEITAQSMVSVNFKVMSIAYAQAAGVLSVTDSADGSVKLYAEKVPEFGLVCDYMIVKGVVV